jgi:hypothetical protein
VVWEGPGQAWPLPDSERGAAGNGGPYRDREYGFTITDHDPDRPWIVRSSEHRTINLPDGQSFFEWAHEQWPAPRWSIELDPWALTPR